MSTGLAGDSPGARGNGVDSKLRFAKEVFLFLSERKPLEDSAFVFQPLTNQVPADVQTMIEMHGVGLRGPGRDIEDQQSAGTKQRGQKLEFSGKVRQMFENVKGEHRIKGLLARGGAELLF